MASKILYSFLSFFVGELIKNFSRSSLSILFASVNTSLYSLKKKKIFDYFVVKIISSRDNKYNSTSVKSINYIFWQFFVENNILFLLMY